MNTPDHFDDPLLNAFVDGQLDAQTCESIIKEMDKNADVREHIYQLRRAKDLMRLGFSNPPMPFENTPPSKSSPWQHFTLALVASITAIAIAAGSGFFGFYIAHQEQLALNNTTPAITKQKTEKILLHISESDTEKFAAALTYTENFLQTHNASSGQIAVVANAGGVDLMRADNSPFEKQIRRIMKKYNNVYFIACANTISLLHEKDISLKLIDNVKTNRPAMDHIIDYVRDGWTYKKVGALKKI